MSRELTGSIRVRDRKRWWELHDQGEYVCPDCGRTNDHPEFTRWEVHHINGEPGKIVGLCQKSHDIRHGAKPKNVSLEWWKEAFLSIGDERSVGDRVVYSRLFTGGEGVASDD